MPVTDTNYAELYNLTALASQGNGLSANGMHQKDLVAQLSELETNWNAILTKLDADGGVNLTTYNATYAIDLDNTTVGSLGLSQAIIVSVLDDFIAKINLCLTALDGDSGVADTNYNSTWAITDVVNAGAGYTIAANKNVAVDDRGYNQGALYDLLNTVVTNVNGVNAKLDADA